MAPKFKERHVVVEHQRTATNADLVYLVDCAKSHNVGLLIVIFFLEEWGECAGGKGLYSVGGVGV